MSFYTKYVALCRNADKTPSAVAEIIGIRKSNVTYWKNGRTKPTDLTLSKIADYFDVPISYFDEKEPPATNGDDVLSAKQIEMIEKIKGMSKEDLDKKWAALSAIFDI